MAGADSYNHALIVTRNIYTVKQNKCEILKQ